MGLAVLAVQWQGCWAGGMRVITIVLVAIPVLGTPVSILVAVPTLVAVRVQVVIVAIPVVVAVPVM